MDYWRDRSPNPEFPACATVARRLLAEVYGCQPGDEIPSEDELMARGRAVAMAGNFGRVADARIALHVNGGWRDYGVEPHPGASLTDACQAQIALNMLEEIGGF